MGVKVSSVSKACVPKHPKLMLTFRSHSGSDSSCLICLLHALGASEAPQSVQCIECHFIAWRPFFPSVPHIVQQFCCGSTLRCVGQLAALYRETRANLWTQSFVLPCARP